MWGSGSNPAPGAFGAGASSSTNPTGFGGFGNNNNNAAGAPSTGFGTGSSNTGFGSRNTFGGGGGGTAPSSSPPPSTFGSGFGSSSGFGNAAAGNNQPQRSPEPAAAFGASGGGFGAGTSAAAAPSNGFGGGPSAPNKFGSGFGANNSSAAAPNSGNAAFSGFGAGIGSNGGGASQGNINNKNSSGAWGAGGRGSEKTNNSNNFGGASFGGGNSSAARTFGTGSVANKPASGFGANATVGEGATDTFGGGAGSTKPASGFGTSAAVGGANGFGSGAVKQFGSGNKNTGTTGFGLNATSGFGANSQQSGFTNIDTNNSGFGAGITATNTNTTSGFGSVPDSGFGSAANKQGFGVSNNETGFGSKSAISNRGFGDANESGSSGFGSGFGANARGSRGADASRSQSPSNNRNSKAKSKRSSRSNQGKTETTASAKTWSRSNAGASVPTSGDGDGSGSSVIENSRGGGLRGLGALGSGRSSSPARGNGSNNKPRFGSPSSKRQQQQPANSTAVYVRAPAQVNNQHVLQAYFAKFGAVRALVCHPDNESAALTMDTAEAAQQIVAQRQHMIDHNRVTTMWDRSANNSNNNNNNTNNNSSYGISQSEQANSMAKPKPSTFTRTTEAIRQEHSFREPPATPGSPSESAEKKKSTSRHMTPSNTHTISETPSRGTPSQSEFGDTPSRVHGAPSTTFRPSAPSSPAWQPSENDNKDFTVGQCELMCPIEETERRERENGIHLLEKPHPDVTGNETLEHLTIKALTRSSPGLVLNDPALVRPDHVLYHTMNYLWANILDLDRKGPDPRFRESRLYTTGDGATPSGPFLTGFVNDRTRSIRKDYSVQGFLEPHGPLSATCIKVFEQCARMHIMADAILCEHTKQEGHDETLNRLEGNNCLKALNEMYNKVRLTFRDGHGDPALVSSNEPEFRAYYLIMQMRSKDTVTTSSFLTDLQGNAPDLLATVELQRAMKLIFAFQTGDYFSFFRIVTNPSTPFLVSCLSHGGFVPMWKMAFMRMSKGYKKGTRRYPVQKLMRMLCFNDNEHLMQFIRFFGGVDTLDGNGAPTDDPAALTYLGFGGDGDGQQADGSFPRSVSIHVANKMLLPDGSVQLRRTIVCDPEEGSHEAQGKLASRRSRLEGLCSRPVARPVGVASSMLRVQASAAPILPVPALTKEEELEAKRQRAMEQMAIGRARKQAQDASTKATGAASVAATTAKYANVEAAAAAEAVQSTSDTSARQAAADAAVSAKKAAQEAEAASKAAEQVSKVVSQIKTVMDVATVTACATAAEEGAAAATRASEAVEIAKTNASAAKVLAVECVQEAAVAEANRLKAEAAATQAQEKSRLKAEKQKREREIEEERQRRIRISLTRACASMRRRTLRERLQLWHSEAERLKREEKERQGRRRARRKAKAIRVCKMLRFKIWRTNARVRVARRQAKRRREMLHVLRIWRERAAAAAAHRRRIQTFQGSLLPTLGDGAFVGPLAGPSWESFGQVGLRVAPRKPCESWQELDSLRDHSCSPFPDLGKFLASALPPSAWHAHNTTATLKLVVLEHTDPRVVYGKISSDIVARQQVMVDEWLRVRMAASGQMPSKKYQNMKGETTQVETLVRFWESLPGGRRIGVCVHVLRCDADSISSSSDGVWEEHVRSCDAVIISMPIPPLRMDSEIDSEKATENEDDARACEPTMRRAAKTLARLWETVGVERTRKLSVLVNTFEPALTSGIWDAAVALEDPQSLYNTNGTVARGMGSLTDELAMLLGVPHNDARIFHVSMLDNKTNDSFVDCNVPAPTVLRQVDVVLRWLLSPTSKMFHDATRRLVTAMPALQDLLKPAVTPSPGGATLIDLSSIRCSRKLKLMLMLASSLPQMLSTLAAELKHKVGSVDVQGSEHQPQLLVSHWLREAFDLSSTVETKDLDVESRLALMRDPNSDARHAFTCQLGRIVSADLILRACSSSSPLSSSASIHRHSALETSISALCFSTANLSGNVLRGGLESTVGGVATAASEIRCESISSFLWTRVAGKIPWPRNAHQYKDGVSLSHMSVYRSTQRAFAEWISVGAQTLLPGGQCASLISQSDEVLRRTAAAATEFACKDVPLRIRSQPHWAVGNMEHRALTLQIFGAVWLEIVNETTGKSSGVDAHSHKRSQAHGENQADQLDVKEEEDMWSVLALECVSFLERNCVARSVPIVHRSTVEAVVEAAINSGEVPSVEQNDDYEMSARMTTSRRFSDSDFLTDAGTRKSFVDELVHACRRQWEKLASDLRNEGRDTGAQRLGECLANVWREVAKSALQWRARDVSTYIERLCESGGGASVLAIRTLILDDDAEWAVILVREHPVWMITMPLKCDTGIDIRVDFKSGSNDVGISKRQHRNSLDKTTDGMSLAVAAQPPISPKRAKVVDTDENAEQAAQLCELESKIAMERELAAREEFKLRALAHISHSFDGVIGSVGDQVWSAGGGRKREEYGSVYGGASKRNKPDYADRSLASRIVKPWGVASTFDARSEMNVREDAEFERLLQGESEAIPSAAAYGVGGVGDYLPRAPF